jgi:hypothetical protein
LKTTVAPVYFHTSRECKLATAKKGFHEAGLCLPGQTESGLDRYAELHVQMYDQAGEATALPPHMLKAFVAGDRGFRKK